MTLAQRVRDQRYAKGWGPDELASRASISRTALYQIESGKTEQPRAATVRRIAEALNIPTEALLGPNLGVIGVAWNGLDAPGNIDAVGHVAEPDKLAYRVRFNAAPSNDPRDRDRDLERKLHELLNSPLGEGVARILEESYRFLPRGVVDLSR